MGTLPLEVGLATIDTIEESGPGAFSGPTASLSEGYGPLKGSRAGLGPDDASSVLTFLEHAPDRAVAEAELDLLGERILGELVALDPGAPGYV